MTSARKALEARKAFKAKLVQKALEVSSARKALEACKAFKAKQANAGGGDLARSTS